eukprot:gene46680-58204_t
MTIYPSPTIFTGNDELSMLGNSLANNEYYSVSGAYGYNIFEGQVNVYKTLPKFKWEFAQTLKSPIAGNINYGVCVDIAPDRNVIVVGANSYSFYAGMVFMYGLNADNVTWGLTNTIWSPSGPDSGFGTRVKVEGDFMLAATYNSNFYFYERQSGGKYLLTSSLTAEGVITSISLSGHHAAVGVETNLNGNSTGSVYVYRLD